MPDSNNNSVYGAMNEARNETRNEARKDLPADHQLNWLIVIGCLCGYYWLNSIIPGFAETFASFEFELPLATQILVNYHTLIFLFLSISLIAAGIYLHVRQEESEFARAAQIYTYISPGLSLCIDRSIGRRVFANF